MPPRNTDTTVYRAPHSRSFTDWTPDDLRAADALAQSGNLRLAADLCRALLGDGRVRAALETRVKGLLRLPVTFEESGDRRKRGRVVRALEAEEDWYNSFSEAALARVAGRGILLGVGLGQFVWMRTSRGREIPVLTPYDERWLRWDTSSRQWMVQVDGGREIEIVPGDGRWFLYAPSCAGIPSGDQRPWDDGAWRAAMKPWLLKDMTGLDDFGHHAQMHGSPLRTADIEVFENGKTAVSKDDRKDLNAQLGDMGSDASMVPPPGVKLRYVEATARTWQMFPAAVSMANIELAVAITGQNLSTEVNAGVGTGATLHGTIRQDLIESDDQTLSTATHDQALVWWAEFNFGSRDLAPWAVHKKTPPENIEARGRGMVTLAAGIEAAEKVAPPGKIVDRQTMFEGAGIPLLDAPEEQAAVP